MVFGSPRLRVSFNWYAQPQECNNGVGFEPTLPAVFCREKSIGCKFQHDPASRLGTSLNLVPHTGFKPASDRFVADRFVQLS
jgi:hypothetical protein